MISEAQARSASRFFFLAFLDEPLALKASAEALQRIARLLHGSPKSPEETEQLLLTSSYATWKKYVAHSGSGQPVTFSFADWTLPANLELGPWLEFRRRSESDEFCAVLMVKVLNLSEKMVSQAMGVSEGTLRHRLNRGLRTLGGCTGAVPS